MWLIILPAVMWFAFVPVFADDSTRSYTLDPAQVTARATAARKDAPAYVRHLLESAGVSLNDPGPTRFFYNDRTGILHVRVSDKDLPSVERIVEALAKPLPRVRIEARIAEVPAEAMTRLGPLMAPPVRPGESSIIAQMQAEAASLQQPVVTPLTKILTAAETAAIFATLENQPGSDLLTAPPVETVSGQPVRITIEDEEPLLIPPLRAPSPRAREALRLNAE